MIAIVNTHPINAWLHVDLKIDSCGQTHLERQSRIFRGKPKIFVNFSSCRLVFVDAAVVVVLPRMCVFFFLNKIHVYCIFFILSLVILLVKILLSNSEIVCVKFNTVLRAAVVYTNLATDFYLAVQRQNVCINFILYTYAYRSRWTHFVLLHRSCLIDFSSSLCAVLARCVFFFAPENYFTFARKRSSSVFNINRSFFLCAVNKFNNIFHCHCTIPS